MSKFKFREPPGDVPFLIVDADGGEWWIDRDGDLLSSEFSVRETAHWVWWKIAASVGDRTISDDSLQSAIDSGVRLPGPTVQGLVLGELDDEIDGCHGESERRAVAEFVRDALDDNDRELAEDPGLAANLCDSLAEAARVLAASLRKIIREAEPCPPPTTPDS